MHFRSTIPFAVALVAALTGAQSALAADAPCAKRTTACKAKSAAEAKETRTTETRSAPAAQAAPATPTAAPAPVTENKPAAAPASKSCTKKPKSKCETGDAPAATTTAGGGVNMVYTAGAVTFFHPGQLLASNCFQCHGTNGRGMEHLAGESAREILDELDEMRMKPASRHIMNVHAQGYTPEQLGQIADYFSKQTR